MVNIALFFALILHIKFYIANIPLDQSKMPVHNSDISLNRNFSFDIHTRSVLERTNEINIPTIGFYIKSKVAPMKPHPLAV